MQTDWLKAIETAQEFLEPFKTGPTSTGIVLGTGLGALVKHINVTHTIPYTEIPHFPTATVEFHKGNLLFGKIGNTSVIAMQGRFHFYEGYTMQEITFPIRVMKALGCSQLLLSNAAGGIHPGYKKGDLVLIDDHINLQTDNPLRGQNNPAFGQRFVDMSRPYSKQLMELLMKVGLEQGTQFRIGVYASVIGPNLETRAEYRFLRTIGADMVGMSTVPEVIVANQIGLPCAGISVITDECDPDNLQPVDIADIIAIAGYADNRLSNILAATIERIE